MPKEAKPRTLSRGARKKSPMNFYGELPRSAMVESLYVKEEERMGKPRVRMQLPTHGHVGQDPYLATEKDTGRTLFVKGPYSEKAWAPVVQMFAEKVKVLLADPEHLLPLGASVEWMVPCEDMFPQRQKPARDPETWEAPLPFIVMPDLCNSDLSRTVVSPKSKTYDPVPVFDKRSSNTQPVNPDRMVLTSKKARLMVMAALCFRFALGITDTCMGNIMMRDFEGDVKIYSVDECGWGSDGGKTRPETIWKMKSSPEWANIFKDILGDIEPELKRVLAGWGVTLLSSEELIVLFSTYGRDIQAAADHLKFLCEGKNLRTVCGVE